MSAEDRLQEIRWLIEAVQERSQFAGSTPREVVTDDELARILALATLEERRP